MDFLRSIFKRKDQGTPAGSQTPPAQTVTVEPVAVEETTVGEPVTVEEKHRYSGSSLVVLLDNGHAKSTPGKRSPALDDGRQFFEYEFNRDVVARIAAALKEEGIRHHILVPEVDKDIALTERANRANKWCKTYGTKNCLFISVHSNALGDGKEWKDAGNWSVWTTVGYTKSDAYAKIMYEVAKEMLEPYGFGCRDGKVQGKGNEGKEQAPLEP